MNFERKFIGPRVPIFWRSSIKYTGIEQENQVIWSMHPQVILFGLTCPLEQTGLPQGFLVKMRIDISLGHIDNCGYN